MDAANPKFFIPHSTIHPRETTMLELSFYCDKEASILEMAGGHRILHLGCVGNTDQPTDLKVKLASRTLHARLTETAALTLGIDLDADAVKSLLDAGVFDNIRYGDACDLDPREVGTNWDLVVVGDLIEHVSNPGLLLNSIRGVMGPETLLVFTTPNAFSLPSAIRHALGRFIEGKEHVMSFNSQNLQQLLDRHGLAATRIGTCYQPMARTSPYFAFGKCLFRMFPRWGGTLFVVASCR